MIRSIVRQWFALVCTPHDIAGDQLKKAQVDLLYAYLDLERQEATVDRLNTTIARLKGLTIEEANS